MFELTFSFHISGYHCQLSEEQGSPITVKLEKGAGGVGFSLEGGKGSIHGDKPLVINRIFKGSYSPDDDENEL